MNQENMDWNKERIIKFRGKPLDESLNWVYGDLIRFPNGATGIHLLDVDGSLSVKPKTRGQFTGMFDKNGTEIYEGDVIKTPLGFIVEVMWGYKEHVVQLRGERCKDAFACNGWLFRNKRGHVDALDKDIAAGEVIGNIHDNPELKSYAGKDIYGLYFKVRINSNEEREKVVNHLHTAGFFYPDDVDKSKVVGILVGNAFIGEITSECIFCDSRHQEYTVEEVLNMDFD